MYLFDLSNREIAFVCWLVLLMAIGLTKSRVRSAFGNLLRILLNWKLIAIFGSYFFGIVFIARQLSILGFWEVSRIPALVLWTLFSGIPIVMTLIEASKVEGLFREHLHKVIGAGAIVIFLSELSTFPLLFELILVPTLVMLTLMLTLSQQDPSNRQVSGCLQSLLFAGAIVILGRSVIWLLRNPELEVIWSELRGFLFFTVLSVYSVGFLWVAAIVSGYETAFKTARLGKEDVGKGAWRGKAALVAVVGPDMRLLSAFKYYWAKRIFSQPTFSKAKNEAEIFRHQYLKSRNATIREEQKLMANAGVKGVDQHGLQLDQREFWETMRMLDRLWTFHTGQYRKESAFKAEVLQFLDSSFRSNDLPRPNGIVQVIADDGQSWRAYRRTVTGWYFGIAGTAVDGDPRTRLIYDGPQPPPDGAGEYWEETPGLTNSRHWSLEY